MRRKGTTHDAVAFTTDGGDDMKRGDRNVQQLRSQQPREKWLCCGDLRKNEVTKIDIKISLYPIASIECTK